MGAAGGPITVLGHDDLCIALGRPVLVFLFARVGRSIDEHDDIRVLLDSARLSEVRELGRLPARCSTARESWERAITGTLSSLARILSPRLMSAISVWRLS